MFAFSPLTGLAVDRFGGRAVAVLGSVVLSTAALLASASPEGESLTLVAGLFLLGLGWSCTLVAGSTLLTAAVPVQERPGAQGASDLLMGLMAGAGGALAGVVVDRGSFEAAGPGRARGRRRDRPGRRPVERPPRPGRTCRPQRVWHGAVGARAARPCDVPRTRRRRVRPPCLARSPTHHGA